MSSAQSLEFWSLSKTKAKRTKTKKGYEVQIEVNNDGDIISLVYHISKTGSATVVASSLNRQSISYMGDIFVAVSENVEDN